MCSIEFDLKFVIDFQNEYRHVIDISIFLVRFMLINQIEDLMLAYIIARSIQVSNS